MQVRFCPGCAQVVPNHYLYCPHCGLELRITPELRELLDRCLRPLEEMEQRNTVQRLDSMLTRLEVLDKGLGLLLGEEQTAACR